MLIFGTRKYLLKKKYSKTLVCNNCGSKGTFVFNIHCSYFHLFYIPMFSLGKTGVAGCSNCKKAKYASDLEGKAKEEYKYINELTPIPVWHFIGTALLLAIGTWFYFHLKDDQQKILGYLENPKIGDVYTFMNDGREYSTFKIIEIDTDSLTINYNLYSTSDYIEIYKMSSEDNYSDEAYRIALHDVRDLYDNDTIKNIQRE